MLGRPGPDLVGVPWPSVLADRAEAVDEETWRAALQGEDAVGHRVIRRPDGSTLLIDFAARGTSVSGRPLMLCLCLHVEQYRADATTDVSGALTDREREIVHLIALGRTSPQIGAELHVADDTVRNHVRNAMAKTGARTRAHLVAIAFTDGLLTS